MYSLSGPVCKLGGKAVVQDAQSSIPRQGTHYAVLTGLQALYPFLFSARALLGDVSIRPLYRGL